jgi:hypothetical protein
MKNFGRSEGPGKGYFFRTQVIPELSLKKRGQSALSQVFDLFGTPGKDRTCDLRIRNPSLYPLSYGGTDSSAQPNWTAKNLRLPSAGKSTPFFNSNHRRMHEDRV